MEEGQTSRRKGGSGERIQALKEELLGTGPKSLEAPGEKRAQRAGWPKTSLTRKGGGVRGGAERGVGSVFRQTIKSAFSGGWEHLGP